MKELTLPTRVARSGFDEHWWFGRAVFGELLGHESLLGLVMLAACGRRPTEEERSLLDEIAVVLTVADARIWPLKIARVLASYGGVMAGFGGAQLCVESDALGPWLSELAAEMLVEVRRAAGDDGDDARFDAAACAAVEARPMPYGYGVPLRASDERFAALERRLEARGRTALPYWRTQARLSTWLRAERDVAPNVGVGVAAALLDMGLDPVAGRVLSIFAMEHLFLAHAVEGAAQRAEVLRALPAERVEYTGPAARLSPRAAEKARAR